jgi:hypothetical protein
VRFAAAQLLALFLCCFCHAAEPVSDLTRYCAVCGLLGVDTILSETGEFIVHAYRAPLFVDPAIRTNQSLLALEPQFVAITAEKTKRLALQELEQQDAFRDKIHIYINDRLRPGQPITLMTRMYRDGFEYLMGVPRHVEHVKIVKAIVQAFLLEMANHGGKRSAEIPSWLVEGFTQEILTSLTPPYVANKRPLTIMRLGYDRLAGARAFFQTNSCLTISELSFSDISALAPDSLELLRYQKSAHLLVHELLHLHDGPRQLTRFIRALPATLNWQTAFYNVYQRQFQTPLDLEKWWALTWVNFQRHREHELWSSALSLDKLQNLLLTPLEFHSRTNALPESRQVTLQQLLKETDFSMQKTVLNHKIQQLYFLSVSLSRETARLAADYEQAMKNYLQDKSRSAYQPGLRADPEIRARLLLKSAIEQFDKLDLTLAQLKQSNSKTASTQPEPSLEARR